MACLSRHKLATSIFRGMAKNCNNLPQFKNLLELQVRNENSLLRFQTIKQYTCHQAGEFAMTVPMNTSVRTQQSVLVLGSVHKLKVCLYGSSNYKNLFNGLHPWDSCKIAQFSTQKFGKTVPQVSQQTIRGSFSQKFSTGQAAGDKSQATLLYLLALVVAMVGSSYAAVPLYRKFCQATGYGGTVQRRETVEEKIARHAQEGTKTSRELVIQFNADVADGMPWKFIPTQREVRVKPGESALAFYTAENFSQKAITGVSTYNVTPMRAAIYFNKIQCFCFEEQRLLPGEKIDMPVFFYVDPEFETDPKMDGINNMILSYTFFKVDEDEALQ